MNRDFLSGIIHDDRRLVCPFEGILRTTRQVLQIRQIHVVGDLSKPQASNNTPMKQAFSMSTLTHRA
jgi:hypothetical protein